MIAQDPSRPIAPFGIDRLEHWRREDITLWNWFSAAFPSAGGCEGWLRNLAGALARQPGPARARIAKTNLVDPAQPAERFSFEGDSFGIGRGTDNAAVLPESTITRNHARLRREGDRFLLEDLGSAMGTIFNGAKVTPEVPLEICHGDHFVIFPYRFDVEIEREWVAGGDALVNGGESSVRAWSDFRDGLPAGFEAFALGVEPLEGGACLAASRGFLEGLAARVLEPAGDAAAWAASAEAIVELVLLAALERANRDLALPFRFSFGRAGRLPRLREDERGIAAAATVGFGGVCGAVRLFLPFDLLGRMHAGWQAKAGKSLAQQATWRFAWTAGYVDLNAAERGAVEAGDVVLYEPACALLFPGDDRAGWPAEASGPGHMRILATLDRRIEMTNATDTEPVTLRDLPVRVQVLLGEREMTLAQAEALAPGSVIDFDHDPAGPVELAVNGRVVGTGELVEIEGRLGVRIAAWSAK